MANDISEDIPLNIGQPTLPSNVYYNSTTAYDVAVGGQPFLLAVSDERPYVRQTAAYRKQQFDSSREPGEQSLEGWWLRSQSSFHRGDGITYYDPSAGEEILYRFADSRGVDVWTPGEVSLLKDVTAGHIVTDPVNGSNTSQQKLQSIVVNGVDQALLWDGHDIDRVFPTITASITNKALTSNVATLTAANHGFVAGSEVVVSGVDATFNGTHSITSVTTNTFSFAKTAADVPSTAVSPAGTAKVGAIHFVEYNAGVDEPAYAVCNDGESAYWVTNAPISGVDKLHIYKKELTKSYLDAPTLMLTNNGITARSAVMEWAKERIIACINNSVYELLPSSSALPTALYAHPDANYRFTAIAELGSAIYVAGFLGGKSSIMKFALESDGGLPTLAFANVAAEMPTGEIIHSMKQYLGVLLIGTNKGIRAAQVDTYYGNMTYGPLIVETEQPVYQFATRDKYAWATASVGDDAGLVRINLGEQISPLVYAWAYDIQAVAADRVTTAVSFLGNGDRKVFTTPGTTSYGRTYIEESANLRESGYVTTGRIRFGMLEKKHFKRFDLRGVIDYGSVSITTIDEDESEYTIITYTPEIGTPEVAISSIDGPREFLSFRMTLSRDASIASLGPTVRGYQIKALPAVARQHIISIPVFIYDRETDRFNVQAGYDGRAYERVNAMEVIDSAGDVVTFQDFRTGEELQVVVEQFTFTAATPPSGDYSGFGGFGQILVRTVS